MRIKDDYVLREIAGDHVLVPTGAAVAKYNGLFAVTEVGARILEIMPDCNGEDDIVAKILEEYDVDEETARRDVHDFIESLRESDILE